MGARKNAARAMARDGTGVQVYQSTYLSCTVGLGMGFTDTE
jgi:hypothetical protein